jgi:hypothetical protein
MVIRDLINKFLKRNKDSIDSENVIFEMNGVVLLKSNDADFEFKSATINEVLEYCEENKLPKIDKVVIMSTYDADVRNQKRSIIFHQRTISKSEGKIVVVEEDGQVIAQVFFNEFVEIKGDN